MPFLVTISISSTRFEVKAAACRECCSCGSGFGGTAASAAAGVVAAAAGSGAGVAGAKRPSLVTAAEVEPPAGVHGKEYMVGSMGYPTGRCM
ncbi:homoserine kinase [Streptomyces calvus]